MTLKFQKAVVNDKKYSEYNFLHPNFIGYLNNFGEILNYQNPLGLGGHNCDKTTAFFEHYFRMPMHDAWLQQDKGINVVDLEYEKDYSKEKYYFFKERIENNAQLTKKFGKTSNVDSRLLHDLEMFFYNCYQAPTFMEGFGQCCMILNEPEFYDKYCEGKNKDFEYHYHWYKKSIMLDWYKTVIVQYLHYHLIERCEKGITTCDTKPYETFYNYLLNDFTIHQIPRMIFDYDKKMYIPYNQNEFIITDTELRLKEEIQAIKKHVPLKERSKYYR